MQDAEKESINERPLVAFRTEAGKTIEKVARMADCGRETARQYKKVMDAGQLERLKKGRRGY